MDAIVSRRRSIYQPQPSTALRQKMKHIVTIVPSDLEARYLELLQFGFQGFGDITCKLEWSPGGDIYVVQVPESLGSLILCNIESVDLAASIKSNICQ